MRRVLRSAALILALTLAAGLTLSCDEGTEMKFDQGSYAAATGDAVQLRFVAEERRSSGCMLIAPETRQVDQTQHIDAWSVEPAEGAAVDSAGRFSASEPGAYTVTATFGGSTYTTHVVVDASGASTVVEPEESDAPAAEPEEDPLAGQWSWTGALESNGVLGPSPNAYTYTFKNEGGYTLWVGDTKICDVALDGSTVRFTAEVMGTAVYEGVLSGDAVVGTQSHDGGKWVGEWRATRVR